MRVAEGLLPAQETSVNPSQTASSVTPNLPGPCRGAHHMHRCHGYTAPRESPPEIVLLRSSVFHHPSSFSAQIPENSSGLMGNSVTPLLDFCANDLQTCPGGTSPASWKQVKLLSYTPPHIIPNPYTPSYRPKPFKPPACRWSSEPSTLCLQVNSDSRLNNNLASIYHQLLDTFI